MFTIGKVTRFFDNENLKLCSSKNKKIIYFTNNLNAWEKDTGFGEYSPSEDRRYKIIPVIIDAWSYISISDEDDNIERRYGSNWILSNDFTHNDYLNIGDNTKQFKSFLERIDRSIDLYLPSTLFEDKSILKRKDLKLCYVDEGIAYFSNNPEQWGDDWNDKPYECNAGTPYDHEDEFEVISIGFNPNDKYEEPTEYFYGIQLSVEEINKKYTPWLIPTDRELEPIFAGDSIYTFCKKIKKANGDIMLKYIFNAEK